jgi:hypothetical protein
LPKRSGVAAAYEKSVMEETELQVVGEPKIAFSVES